MERSLLEEYIDACELIKDIEDELEQLNDKTTVFDKVKGSNPDFPYQAQSFNVYGTVSSSVDEEKRRLLMQQYSKAVGIKTAVETWISTIPIRMQRIIRYKIFERLTWADVGGRMGELSGENVRKEYYRFMNRQKNK